MYTMIMNPWFDTSIILVILLNTIVLAMDRNEPYPEGFSHGLHIVNLVFSAIFTAEAVIKIIGMGVRPYITDSMN